MYGDCAPETEYCSTCDKELTREDYEDSRHPELCIACREENAIAVADALTANRKQRERQAREAVAARRWDTNRREWVADRSHRIA